MAAYSDMVSALMSAAEPYGRQDMLQQRMGAMTPQQTQMAQSRWGGLSPEMQSMAIERIANFQPQQNQNTNIWSGKPREPMQPYRGASGYLGVVGGNNQSYVPRVENGPRPGVPVNQMSY